MTHVVAAFASAKREVEKEARAGFVEGQMWEELVCRLTDFAKQRCYPVGASKGIDKSTSDKASPFIGLVRNCKTRSRKSADGIRRATWRSPKQSPPLVARGATNGRLSWRRPPVNLPPKSLESAQSHPRKPRVAAFRG
jgi:hypothetical protein